VLIGGEVYFLPGAEPTATGRKPEAQAVKRADTRSALRAAPAAGELA
jgi:hypothetical protein